MYALISPDHYICQLSAEPFDVAEPLFWVEIPNYDPNANYQFVDGEIVIFPPPPKMLEV